MTKLKRVIPSEKKKIIQVSVQRLYSEAQERALESSERPGYTTNTQRSAEENFMSSLRSDRNEKGESSERKGGSGVI